MRLAVALLVPLLLAAASRVSAQRETWPRRVLITNDDGIEDAGILALARAFARVAETYVVAPATDRSGSSNYAPGLQTRSFTVERRDLGDSAVVAYALHGYPAECLIFALSGPMRDVPPDLVISGVNGGPNLADAWFGSGTIGAARTAAYFGVPAIAVSGLREDDPEAVRAVADWGVELTRSEPVRNLEPPQYLTVSIPLIPPSEIHGVEVVRRAYGLLSGIARATVEA
jgi:5'-nucleotidase